ncbi:PREDICTED: uncharacterized protein LOC100631742 [Amphimedon queenslandica]|uniref:Hyccin n=1 Tax=Amphimedon queenslandica TaxID=400682 RepID=A0A1X7UWF1_AMPQE|nr:PREDICTED: uncharacterized protein LOC100631742 [Amphimedon queenslandica]|eukprot:XP_003386544.2 PREDICTED: uncharacterized protein LOC100631742 [Amphimedon queenslandica]
MENGDHDETIETLQSPNIWEVMEEYQKRKGPKVEEYLQNNEGAVREALNNQTQEFTPDLFEWLYNVSLTSKENKKLFIFVTQFIPDLIYIYSVSATNNDTKLKTAIEALLLGLIKLAESERKSSIQVPDMSKPSIYHQVTSSLSPLSLTIAALTRHNQTESPSPRPLFSSSDTVTVSNRLLFLSTLVMMCTECITLFPVVSQKMFCISCIKYVCRGMHSQFVGALKDSCNKDGCMSFTDLTLLSKEKRLMINDDLLSVLLQGTRLCLCTSFHYTVLQCLNALKLRACYEVLPLSMQISAALERLTSEMNPLKLPFDPQSHKTYSPRDSTHWPSRPMTVFRSLTGQVLHHQLSPAPSNDNELYDSLEGEEQIDAEFHLKFSESTEPHTGSKDSDSDTDFETLRQTGIELSPNQINVEVLSTEDSVSPSELNKEETVSDHETHCKSTAV